MSWTVHTVEQNIANSGVTSLSVNKPSGAGAGSACIITINWGANAGTQTLPSGFTTMDGQVNRWSGYRILDGSEGASFAFSWTTPQRCVVCCMAATPSSTPAILTDADLAATTGVTAHPTAVVAAADDAWLVATWSALAPGGTQTWTTSDMTEQGEQQMTSGQLSTLMVASDLEAAANASTQRNATSSISVNGRSHIYAFEPSAAAGQPASKRVGGVPFMGAREPHNPGIRRWSRRHSGLLVPSMGRI